MNSILSFPESASMCQRCAVHMHAICGVSKLSTHVELSKIAHRRLTKVDETILAHGAAANLVGIVRAGILRVSKTLPDGREQIVGLKYPGDFFGQLYQPVMEFAVESATEAELCVMERSAYEAVISRHRDLGHAVLMSTFVDLAAAQERSLLLGCQTTLERVATYLLVMLDRREQIITNMAMKSQKRVAVSSISRRDLASYLSTTFETISRHVHYLSGLGIIRIIDSSHYEVLDVDRLQTIAGVSFDDLKLLRRPLSSAEARSKFALGSD